MPNYTLSTTDKTYHLYFKGDNHARDGARREANLTGKNVRVFDGLGRLLWSEQPDDSPLRKSARYSECKMQTINSVTIEKLIAACKTGALQFEMMIEHGLANEIVKNQWREMAKMFREAIRDTEGS